MQKSSLFWSSLASALGVLLYTAAVAWLMFNGQQIFGKPENFLLPMFLLMLFVISASITGLIVLGRPIHLYLNGLKREAVLLLVCTLGWMVVIAGLVAAGLLMQ